MKVCEKKEADCVDTNLKHGNS